MTDYKELIERLRTHALISSEWPSIYGWATKDCNKAADAIEELLQRVASVGPNVSENPTGWTPVSEGLPEDLQEVNVTWVNRKPASYYSHIKDKPFTATAVFYGGNWYWYTAQVTDYLGEYGECDTELIDSDIEITAWQPLPEPYKGEE